MKKKNSKRTFFNDFDEFEDMEEYEDYNDEEDENLNSYSTTQDFSDVSYDDFNKVIEVEDDDSDEELYEVEDDDEEDNEAHIVRKGSTKNDETDLLNAQLLVILNNFWLVFRVIGIGIAVVLFFYFLLNGRIGDLFSYLLLLAGSFIFGFVFMFFVNKLMESK